MSQPQKILFDNRIKRKNVLALNEKVAAIREFEKTPVYKHVGRNFHCSPDQIKRIILQKDDILKAWEQRTRRNNEVKSLEMKSVRVSMLGKSVYEWIRRMMYYKDFMITDGLIQKMALQFKSAFGMQVFFPHQDWCDKFRVTYNIKENDTKKLDIAYTEGHSVQIKDIIRDVLGTCTQNNGEGSNADADTVEIDDDDDDEEFESKDHQLDNEESEEEKKEDKYQPPTPPPQQQQQQLKRQVAKKHIGPPIAQAKMTPTAIFPQQRLVAMQLPIGVQRTAAGTISQKVLVATPITPGSTAPGATPMTMTIIPLASVAQTLNYPKPQLPAAEKTIVPPPKVEIKREIDDGEEEIHIKKEYISDDEEEIPMANNAIDFNEHEKENSNLKQIINKDTANTPMDAECSEEEDNLALSQLQKGLANKNRTTAIIPPSSTTTWMTAIPLQIQNEKELNSNSQSQILPAMPPLVRAPTVVNATSSSSSSPSPSLSSSSPQAQKTLGSSTRKRQHANLNNSPSLPPIRTCAEARKYLKLLEDFALVRENFRLIGLITRADEVLRELDGDEDIDVD